MAIVTKQYFLFLRTHVVESPDDVLIRRSEGFPDERDDVAYTNDQRVTIITMINSVFQQGVRESFPLLPSLLAPLSRGNYNFEMSRPVLDTRALLIWQKLSPAQRRRHQAHYQISFFIPSQPPFAATNLAYFLLFFTYSATRTYVTAHYNYDVYRQPQLRGLAYHLRATGATGVAFYNFIDDAYNDALACCDSYPKYTSHGLSGLPLSTWPALDTTLSAEDIVVKCRVDSAYCVGQDPFRLTFPTHHVCRVRTIVYAA